MKFEDFEAPKYFFLIQSKLKSLANFQDLLGISGFLQCCFTWKQI